LAATHVQYEVDGWGVGELWLDGRRVVWSQHPYPHPGWGTNPPPSPATLPKRDAPNGDDFAPILVARLQAFFAGAGDDFADVEVDLEELTPFGRELATALRRVPRGEIVTYGELAALAGRPGAARAAGTFCANNKLAIFVPCHRVVGSNGIGGYGSLGLDYKRRLLALEHVAL
jgi:methylated-DNA-[protein]-cysteine S-methyltransferase